MVELFKEFFIENYYKNKIDFIPRYFLFNPLYPECDINFEGELIEDESEYDKFHHCSYEYEINNTTYDSYRNIEEVLLLEDLNNVISYVLSQVNELEETIIRMRYGLGEIDTEYTLEEIAKELGRSGERVRQIELSAIKKLKHPKVNKMLKVYLNEDMSGDFSILIDTEDGDVIKKYFSEVKKPNYYSIKEFIITEISKVKVAYDKNK